MAGEYAAHERRHRLLVLQEPPGGVGDRLGVVTDFEGDDGTDLQCDPLLGHAGLGHLGLLHGQGQRYAVRLRTGKTNAPWPTTIRNGASPGPCPRRSAVLHWAMARANRTWSCPPIGRINEKCARPSQRHHFNRARAAVYNHNDLGPYL